MPGAARRAIAGFWLGAVAAGMLIGVLAELRAQPASGDETAVLAADEALGEALRSGDKSVARRLLALQFTYTDENGKVHERKALLDDLKGVAAAPATDVKAKIYGLVAVITGKRKSAPGTETFFLDIWAKQKGAWRALTMQDVVLTAAVAPPATHDTPGARTEPYECKNPCQIIPYRVRSSAEQDIVNAFQAIAKATVARDADEWGKHIAEEFMHYRSGHAPVPKSGSIATIERQKTRSAAGPVSAIESMRLWVYGDGAAMIATHTAANDPVPLFRAASVWVRRNGQWQLAISAETDIKNP